VFVLSNWKFQKHLYDRFGGGQILFQQAGTEAFDAMHKWLLAQEAAGKFKVADPQSRELLFRYWTAQDHGAFLSKDQEAIREFLQPEWTQAPAEEKKTS
jgi:hypothetical protein